MTAAAVGTTTYACDGQALAFGHPFLYGGQIVARRQRGLRVRDRARDRSTARSSSPRSPSRSASSTRTASPVSAHLARRRARGDPARDRRERPGARRRAPVSPRSSRTTGAATSCSSACSRGIDSTFDASGSGIDYAGRGTALACWTFDGTARGRHAVAVPARQPLRLEVRGLAHGRAQPRVPARHPDLQPVRGDHRDERQGPLTLEKAVKLYTIKEILVAMGNRPSSRATGSPSSAG